MKRLQRLRGGYNAGMPSTIRNRNVEDSRIQLRASLRTTRWLRRVAVLLGLVIIGLLLSFRFQG
jgi:hypothetical protein